MAAPVLRGVAFVPLEPDASLEDVRWPNHILSIYIQYTQSKYGSGKGALSATGGRCQSGDRSSQGGHRRREQDVETRHGRKRPSWGLALPGGTSPQGAGRGNPPPAEEANQAIGVPRRCMPGAMRGDPPQAEILIRARALEKQRLPSCLCPHTFVFPVTRLWPADLPPGSAKPQLGMGRIDQRRAFAVISGHAHGRPRATTRHQRKMPSWGLALPGGTSPQGAGRDNPPPAEDANQAVDAPGHMPVHRKCRGGVTSRTPFAQSALSSSSRTPQEPGMVNSRTR